ncbi:COMM domain-containing protein 5-like [Mizuhopecten yessoensis]|uniref:COMM domain-containing protein 5 n=1 Tax=Mizuhopecten yessoensis TaxID=6573 RepID=A0A210QYG1_MIZYE|nr:COMM domain-containing protein 5-like [Mizuhopecten yessoensis]OWF53764.1 COMM domain-containing protein 5 [Mizuhopecten yessoensis]
MSIIQVKGSGGSVAVDRSPFYGGRVPQEIKAISKPMAKIDKQTFRKLLQMIVSSMEGKEIDCAVLEELEHDIFTKEVLSIVYTGLYSLLRRAIRLPLTSLKPEMFKEDIKELNIPEEFHSDLASVIFGSRGPQITAHCLENRPRLPRLDCLKWRVDVAISTSVLNRVLEPSILMELTLSDGRIHTFEIPVAKFHELRYNVAFVLKEMEDLEKRSILKIKD